MIADGRGAILTDVDGNAFVDFTGGVGCLNVGHAHPHVVAAAQEQLARFAHTDFTIVPYEAPSPPRPTTPPPAAHRRGPLGAAAAGPGPFAELRRPGGVGAGRGPP